MLWKYWKNIKIDKDNATSQWGESKTLEVEPVEYKIIKVLFHTIDKCNFRLGPGFTRSTQVSSCTMVGWDH